MSVLPYKNSIYISPERKVSLSRKIFPSFWFYCQVFLIVARSAEKAKRGTYDGVEWASSSQDILRAIEDIGVRVEITGIEHISGNNGPAVIIGNHMSMMETLLLPGIIQPEMDVTFVIKESLLRYPIFKHVMQARNPIAVGRTNPRQDLKVVMTEGMDRLGRGISVIVFPQTTRSHTFDPGQMSSIGVKLARRAGVAVVPL
ncbi:MAG: 1-acyl-sn-glycerol-3-phosphate acyltransferase, partial [Deltaproteobacteria bacterium]|nr:1-acyl-sn-glycerol-3-phosphate acyltransferase [Deltaproteobacteria bacterium]